MDGRRARRVALALTVLGAVVAFLSASELFPYRSLNHDEGVYLQQAAMLLEGQLYYRPPVPGAMRPWFFVVSESGMYPKYAPVPAAVFALGKLLGAYELALVGVGAALVGLTYDVTARAFDRRTGLLAAALLLTAPMFVVQSGSFLPYAVTTALNLGFAAAFLRADETGNPRWAALAGAPVGFAAFARPYTAVLFAAPFIVASLADLYHEFRGSVVRHGTTALFGAAGVALALGYNAIVTGDPFTFPYAAFAPLDGLGFGHRELLGHELDYTLELAVESNAAAVRTLLTDWGPLGALGTALAAVGTVVVGRRASDRGVERGPLLLAGVFVSVVVGNLYFWGTYNALGAIDDPNDGLVHFLGPYYHYDTLLPLAAFAAVGALALAGRARRRIDDLFPEHRRAALVVCLLLGGALAAGVGGLALARPVGDNAVVTDEYAAAYEPIETEDPENAVVFLPDTYGPWLNHPFQHLRNDPDFDSGAVYALDDEENFAVVDSFPNRTLYRYGYRGVWNPTDGTPVTPRLQRVERASGERVTFAARVGLPASADSVSVRLEGEDGASAVYGARANKNLPLNLTLAGGEATLSGPIERTDTGSEGTIAVSGPTELVLTVFVDVAPGNRLTYRFTLPAEARNGSVRALTADIEACRIARRCGDAAAYVPGESDLPEWTSVETALQNGSAERTRSRTQTRTMERAMSRPPVSGSRVVSPSRSPYSMGTSRTS